MRRRLSFVTMFFLLTGFSVHVDASCQMFNGSLVPTDTNVPIIAMLRHDLDLAIATEDSQVFKNAYSKKTPVTHHVLKKGYIVNVRRSTSEYFPYQIYADPSSVYAQSYKVPKSKWRLIPKSCKDQLIDLLFLRVDKKARSVSAVKFKHFPWARASANAREVLKDGTNIEVLRRTRDHRWYFVRYWIDSRNKWEMGWVPAETVNLPKVHQTESDGHPGIPSKETNERSRTSRKDKTNFE